MCFSQEMSAGFSIVGLLLAAWVHRYNGNSRLIKCILYFVSMEMLQVVQYSFIARDIDPKNPTLTQMQDSEVCQSQANRVLTLIGLLHIAFQPFYSSHMACAFIRSEKNDAQFGVVKRLQLFGAAFILLRYGLTLIPRATFEQLGFDGRYAFDGGGNWSRDTDVEWLSGPALCTYMGEHHLAWSVPFVPVSYYSSSMGIHSFLMFVPFFAMDHGSFGANVGNYIGGTILFFTGPFLGDWITGNKHEAASIWCFFSIMQVCLLVIILAGQQMAKGRWSIADQEKLLAKQSAKETKKGK